MRCILVDLHPRGGRLFIAAANSRAERALGLESASWLPG